MTPPIPFTVVGGYLGAGKTTLLNRILTGDHGRRLAVIVNDFGEIAIDADLVESDSGTVRALANGCVCCSLVDGFAATLREIAALDPAPDHVLVEVSGVGDPWAVAQWGRTPGYSLEGVVVVVDPETIEELDLDVHIGETVRSQLGAADVIVLSRADVVSRTTLDAATAEVARHSAAPLLDGDVALGLLLELPSVGAAAPVHARHLAWTASPRPVDRASLTSWLEAAPAGVMRVKGFVDAPEGRLLAQRVGRRVEVTRHRGPASSDPRLSVVATPAADEAAVEQWLARLVR